jgi:IclR family KDG regulon transcriptional repressor
MKKEINQENQNAYKSISHAAKILSCLSDGKNSVTEIAQHCELSKPTVSRLLQALEKSHLAIRDPVHRKYFLGSLLNRLVANPKTTHLNLITLSIEEMNHLSKMCGETVILGILVGAQNIRLHMIPSIHNIRVYDDENYDITGLNLHAAATKASLAQLERKELSLVIDNILTETATQDPNFDQKQFLSQIDQIRKQGYAISRGEKIAGALAISVPIKGYHFPAVLSVVGIESRFESKIPALLPEIIAGANHISGNIPKSA